MSPMVQPVPRSQGVFLSDALLLLAAMIWGLSFVAQRAGMEYVGPFAFNAVRFALGALSLLPLLPFARRFSPSLAESPAGGASGSAPRIGALRAGSITGVVLFVASSLQQAGLVYTSAGKAAFITGLYVVLVPLAGLLRGHRAGWSRWIGAALSVTGLFLLSVTASFQVGFGEILVLAGAFFWAAHIHLVGWMSPRTDVVAFSCIQFAVCSVLSAAVAAAAEPVSLAGPLSAAWPILYGGVMSVGVAFTLQAAAQRTAHPAHTAILLSLESVFAALGGAILLGERLGTRGTAGCAIMLAGMIVSQVPLIAYSFRRTGRLRGS